VVDASIAVADDDHSVVDAGIAVADDDHSVVDAGTQFNDVSVVSPTPDIQADAIIRANRAPFDNLQRATAPSETRPVECRCNRLFPPIPAPATRKS